MEAARSGLPGAHNGPGAVALAGRWAIKYFMPDAGAAATR